MEWCIDANVAVKAVIKEDFSKNAMALISDASNMEIRLIAPHFFDAETNGAVRKKVYSGEITVKFGDIAFERLRELPTQMLSTSHLLDRAWEIAKQFRLRWLYDAFYVALAEERDCLLWTADMELYNSVKHELIFVKSLEDYTGLI
ncbi:MAG: type II toxin-antitoxin system VapC family toxin [Candidatus Poribacteria bacterium]